VTADWRVLIVPLQVNKQINELCIVIRLETFFCAQVQK